MHSHSKRTPGEGENGGKSIFGLLYIVGVRDGVHERGW